MLPGGGGAYSYRQLEQLWVSAGGNAKLAPIMAAIAMAESGGTPGARNPSSGAAGLWQIDGLPFAGNPFNPETNARMAVAKYHGQGLKAWTTYTSGAYKKYVQGNVSATPPVTGGQAFVDEAALFEGKPYVWGGESPKGFDCSGLVQYVAQKLGLRNVPRTSEEQWAYTQHITRSQLKPGDLVFYAGSDGTPASPGHVAIYAGGGQIIQAEMTGTNIGKFPMVSSGTGQPVGYGRIPGINQATFTGGKGPQVVFHGGGLNPFAAIGDVAGAVGRIGDVLASLEHGIAWLFVPNHWVRIICAVLGVPMVGLGIATMTRTGQSYSIQGQPAPGGQLAPALGIAEVTLGATLLFIAFHNLPSTVTDWPGLISFMQGELQSQGRQP